MNKIDVEYIPSEMKIIVTFDSLIINITKEYIKEHNSDLDNRQCKRVLWWLREMYDEHVGINIGVINKQADGVRSGLL
jgi:hypothetical protein